MRLFSFFSRSSADRIAFLRSEIDKKGPGLEIGPSYRPIAPKAEGYVVDIIDHLDTNGLREKYRDHTYVDETRIEEVDFVWQGESYAELTGKPGHYRWIVASHVIEHCPDLIGFLQQCASLLASKGRLVLAVPDKRFCFDAYRPVSGLARVIDQHLSRAGQHTAGEVAEEYLYCVNLDGKIAWDPDTKGETHVFHPPEKGRAGMQEVISTGQAPDVHSWCFTPSSFHLMIQDLNYLGFIPFYVERIQPAPQGEFFCTLTTDSKAGILLNRLDLQRAIHTELRAIRW